MRTFLVLAAIVAGLGGLSGNAQAAGQIYLLKGFAGIFSLGLDTLGEQLAVRGYKPRYHSYAEADSLAVEATKLEKSGKGPIIIVGHSLGADAAISMAEKMKDAGGKVALIVTYGPDYRQSAPANVARVLNYYQGGATIDKGPGFKGVISNINLNASSDINHFNIEKIGRLHLQTIASIDAATRRNRPSPKPVQPASTGARQGNAGPQALIPPHAGGGQPGQ